MWRKGYIERVKRLTSRAVELRLEIRGGTPKVHAGQFVVLEGMVNGQPQRASFSLSGIEADHWRLGVKEARKGGVSEWLCGLNALRYVWLVRSEILPSTGRFRAMSLWQVAVESVRFIA